MHVARLLLFRREAQILRRGEDRNTRAVRLLKDAKVQASRLSTLPLSSRACEGYR